MHIKGILTCSQFIMNTQYLSTHIQDEPIML